MTSTHRFVGLVPAAGRGSRISPLPMSKELFPIGFQAMGDRPGLRPKVVCQYLLETMHHAGITDVFFILRPGKWDIPAYFGDGAQLGMHLAYLTVHVPFGVPFSLNQAYPFIQDAQIVIGFPDILFEPNHAYQTLIDRQARTQADVVLGLFPTNQPHKVGVVDFDETGRVSAIIDKSPAATLKYMWAIALWQPSFSKFLHNFVDVHLQRYLGGQVPQMIQSLPHPPEIPIGDVIHAAIGSGFQVEAEVFEDGHYIDIGTSEDLIRAVQQFGQVPNLDK